MLNSGRKIRTLVLTEIKILDGTKNHNPPPPPPPFKLNGRSLINFVSLLFAPQYARFCF